MMMMMMMTELMVTRVCVAALESVQSELFEVKSKYDEATSAK